jgi:hypothetical protein
VFNVADIALTAAAVVILHRGFTGATMDGGTDGDGDGDGGDEIVDEART